MRQPVLYLSILLLLGACTSLDDLTRTYDITPEDTGNPLIMNAQMDAGADTQTVFFHTGHPDEATLTAVSRFCVKVNGTTVAEGASETGSPTFSAAFHPGDRVEMEARANDGRSVRAETVVPAPLSILSQEVQISEDEMMQCRLRVADRPGEKNWYRLGVWVQTSYDRQLPERPYEHLVFLSESNLVNISGDPILSSGYSSGEEDDGLLGLMQPENGWMIFNDQAFTDGEATLHFSLYVPEIFFFRYLRNNGKDYDGNPVKNVELNLILKVYSLSEDQYRYLKAVNAMDYYSYDFNFLSEPITLPTNVEGGLGLVTVDYPASVMVGIDLDS